MSHLIRSKPFDLEADYNFGEQLQREIEYKLNTLFSSEFYNAIDNPTLPKYFLHKQVSQGFPEQTVTIFLYRLFKELSFSLAKPGLLPERSAIVDRSRTCTSEQIQMN